MNVLLSWAVRAICSEKTGVETDPLTKALQADESGSASGDKSLRVVVSGNSSFESFYEQGSGGPHRLDGDDDREARESPFD